MTCRQSYAEEFEKAADALRMEDAKTALGKVDATAETALATKYEVKSYPTLKCLESDSSPT